MFMCVPGAGEGVGGVGSAPAGQAHLLRLEAALDRGVNPADLNQYPRFPSVCGRCMVQDASSAVLQVRGVVCCVSYAKWGW
jgi:hypothetical protein